MRAVRIHEFGGPEMLQLEELGIPTPGNDEALIRVHAAGVNPVDIKIVGGQFPPVQKGQLPFTVGQDVSGTIEFAGPGFKAFNLAEPVIAFLPPGRGGYAEYVVIKESEAAPKPREVDHRGAAALPLAATTAWQALFDHGQLGSNQRVLIHGAAGGVGHFAVQLAALAGAEVIATTSAADRDFVRGLGAARVIDYRGERFEDGIQEVDLVLDLVGGDTQERSWRVLKSGGRLVSTVADPASTRPTDRDAQGLFFMARPRAGDLARLSNLVDEGKLRPAVDRVFALAEAPAAHRHLARGGHRGKVVLDIELQPADLNAVMAERRETATHDAQISPHDRGTDPVREDLYGQNPVRDRPV